MTNYFRFAAVDDLLSHKGDNRGISLAVLPVAGLGNKLFVWAKAATFAHQNRTPLAVFGWSWPRARSLLRDAVRGERQYSRYFVSRYRELARALTSMAVMRRIIANPSADDAPPIGQAVFVFNKIPHWSDYFGAIREQRALVRELLHAELAPETRAALERCPRPCIAVHIRHGDFRELGTNEDFAKVGAVRTPLTYFETLIRQIRARRRENLPVTLFSDGTDAELVPLLMLPNVTRSGGGSDVLDLLLMSRASLILSAAGSTFSQWSGFLADAPLIMHPSHIHAPVRPRYVNERFYEGAAVGNADNWPDLLRVNIDQISVE
jgi:Glycosyl transferase family 11